MSHFANCASTVNFAGVTLKKVRLSLHNGLQMIHFCRSNVASFMAFVCTLLILTQTVAGSMLLQKCIGMKYWIAALFPNPFWQQKAQLTSDYVTSYQC